MTETRETAEARDAREAPRRYEPGQVEPKWQRYWLEHETFKAGEDTSKPKYYVLDMFPYPSGDGLHVGHPEGYTATDIVARHKRMRGFNVLHPMGWDAFGLPAEQHALKTGTHPAQTTARNVATFKRQLQRLGFSYDWSREVNTTDPGYYRWTQWIFLQLFRRGLAYEAEMPVNFCPALGTVLANEEVIDGRSEVGGHPVIRKPMRQWVLKITEYAERLLSGLEGLDWPESIKAMQRNWIGRSEGAEVRFRVQGAGADDAGVDIFTTRPDTLFGATYMVLAPEHPLVERITTDAQRAAVRAYVEEASTKSELARTELGQKKTGVFTGGFAVNPVNDRAIPIWIADYVLLSYGTGAIMAVPGHDQRDWEFAKAFGLPIVPVVAKPDGTLPDLDRAAYTEDGVATGSGAFDGLATPAFKEAMLRWLEEKGLGRRKVNYRLRDWLFSRQRYWGEPIPILHLADGTQKALADDELPLLLPEVESYKPSDTGESPLANAAAWVATTDPATGQPARRETNTMPQWAGSCWYYLRFIDPHNRERFVDPAKERYWMPVDLYVGGAEHAVLHLLYARFWHKVLFDAGLVSTDEPFQKLVNQGMILGEIELTWFFDEDGKPVSARHVVQDGDRRIDGRTGKPVKAVRLPDDVETVKKGDAVVLATDPAIEVDARAYKMSKSRGNVVNPDAIIERFGADALRLYEMFMGPLEATKPWATKDIVGIARFLDRAYRLSQQPLVAGMGDDALTRLVHRTIEKVGADIERLQLNTAISALMILTNEMLKQPTTPKDALSALARLLAPFAPHLAEEMWEALGEPPSIAHAAWPSFDPALVRDEEVEIAVQVNGKVRARIKLAAGLDREATERAVLADPKVRELIGGQPIAKLVAVPGKIANLVLGKA